MEGYIRMRDYKWYTKFKNLIKNRLKGLSWSWSYGRWIYNYLCNHCLSPLTLWVRTHSVEVYLLQHYVIKFVSDLRQVSGLLWILRFPQPIKLTSLCNLNIVESSVKHPNPKGHPFQVWFPLIEQYCRRLKCEKDRMKDNKRMRGSKWCTKTAAFLIVRGMF
jgi:hypothetical protein